MVSSGRTTVWAKYRRSDMDLVEKRVLEEEEVWRGSDDYYVWGRYYVISGRKESPELSVVFMDWRTGEVVRKVELPLRCECYR